MKKRFTDEQIIGFLKQADATYAVKALFSQYGFSDASFYTWRVKFGDMTVSNAKRLQAPEAENAQLKKLLAESILDAEALKVALGRKRRAHRPSMTQWWRCKRRQQFPSPVPIGGTVIHRLALSEKSPSLERAIAESHG